MKKTLVAAAVAAIVAAPAAFADATVYGKARVSIDSLDYQAANSDKMQVADRVSRVGVKGSEDLGDGMKAIFGMEWGVSLDSGEGTSNFSARNQFVGLSGGFGTVLAGKHDTPYKMVGSADVFADTAADSEKNGGIIGHNNFDKRANNAVAYVSPSFNGWTIIAAGVAGETATSPKANGLTDAISLGVTGAIGPVKLGLGYESESSGLANALGYGNKSRSAMKADVKYAVGDFGLGATYEQSENTAITRDKDTGMLVSATYAMGNNVLAAQYGKYDAKLSTGTDITMTGVGLIHNFSKNTNAYVAYAKFDESGTAANDLSAVTVGLNTQF